MSGASQQAAAHKAAGNRHYAAGEFVEALQDYEAALSLLAENDSEALVLENNRAAVNLKLRRAKDCAECCCRVLAAKPCDVKARARLARAEAAQGRPAEAFRVLAAHPESACAEDRRPLDELRVKLEAAEALLASGHAALEEGRHVFSRLEDDLLFDCPSLLASMGRCYLVLGELSRAIHVTSFLLRRDSSD
ncbi:unnamed protein product, partial [Polarella glacialis]